MADYNELDVTRSDVKSKRELWQGVQDLAQFSSAWRGSVFSEADIEAIDEQVHCFAVLLSKMIKDLPNNHVVPLFGSSIRMWEDCLPTLLDLKSESMEVCHWQELEDMVGVDLHKAIKRGAFIEEILGHEKLLVEAGRIHNIVVTAKEENKLSVSLKRVEDTWRETYFTVLDYKPDVYHKCYIIGHVDEVSSILEDSQTTVTAILGSRYVSRMLTKVQDWDRKLERVYETIGAWVSCQEKWLYLESVFNSPDIAKHLHQEDKMFHHVDKRWKEAMRKVKSDNMAIKVGMTSGLLEMFQSSNEKLEQILRNLETYLEQKRLGFPRFNFLGDHDLVNILSNSKSPAAVQPHMSKMFHGVKSLAVADEDELEMHSVADFKGEIVQLAKPVTVAISGTGSDVQVWLGKVESQLRNSLVQEMKRAIRCYSDDDLDVFACNGGIPAMCLITAMQVHWALEVT